MHYYTPFNPVASLRILNPYPALLGVDPASLALLVLIPGANVSVKMGGVYL